MDNPRLPLERQPLWAYLMTTGSWRSTSYNAWLYGDDDEDEDADEGLREVEVNDAGHLVWYTPARQEDDWGEDDPTWFTNDIYD